MPRKTRVQYPGAIYHVTSADANGNQTRILSLNPNGSDLAYQYDSLNRLTNVADARAGAASPTTYGYDAEGNSSA